MTTKISAESYTEYTVDLTPVVKKIKSIPYETYLFPQEKKKFWDAFPILAEEYCFLDTAINPARIMFFSLITKHLHTWNETQHVYLERFFTPDKQ